jgi:hypothetical protein
MYEGMYNGHYYLIEQDRIRDGLSVDGLVESVKANSTQDVTWDETWEYVKGHDGCIVHCKDGLLMVNSHGEYASDTGFHLVALTSHEVQQARVMHELKEYM